MVAIRHSATHPDAGTSRQVVADQTLTLAMNFLFMHEGLGMAS